MSAKREQWYYDVIRRLIMYKPNQDRINYIIKELDMLGVKLTPGYSLQPHGSGVSDSTGDLATKVSDKHNELLQLHRDSELTDYAISMLGIQKQLIIRLKYLEDNKDDYVQRVLNKKFGFKARQTYYTYKDEAIEELANKFGIRHLVDKL